MVVAVYNGRKYKIVRSRGKWELISKRSQSPGDGFVKDGGIFYRPIDDIMSLENIYEVWIVADYETDLENVSKRWRIDISKESMIGSKVKLLFGEGILPGWTIEDKNVCSKYVDASDLTAAYLVKRSIIDNNAVSAENITSTLRTVFNEFVSL